MQRRLPHEAPLQFQKGSTTSQGRRGPFSALQCHLLILVCSGSLESNSQPLGHGKGRQPHLWQPGNQRPGPATGETGAEGARTLLLLLLLPLLLRVLLVVFVLLLSLLLFLLLLIILSMLLLLLWLGWG